MAERHASRREFLKTVAGGLLGCSIISDLAAGAGAQNSPNLVFVFPDQPTRCEFMRWDS